MPKKFLSRLKKIYHQKDILWQMSINGLRTKYSGSILGIWWAIVTPLILAISISFVFSNVFSVSIKNYTLFVLSGIIPWIFFSNTVLESTNSFFSCASILKQAIFPREFAPLSITFANFLSFIIGFLVIIPIFVISNIEIIKTIWVVFFILALHLIFIAGLGILFSSLNVLFKDFSHFLSSILMVWFWLTPIFYNIDMVPLPYRNICLLNPLSHYTVMYKSALLYGRIPGTEVWLICFLLSFSSIILGYSFFLHKENILLKKI